jgi:hypothetical protein
MFSFKQFFMEVVTKDCSTGAGEIPDGPYKGWKVIRTRHLDEPRPPSDEERDEGFDCKTFEKIVMTFLQKRPLGIQDGSYQLVWKNDKGYQVVVVDVNNKDKKITFITVIQGNKKNPIGYMTAPSMKKHQRLINLGKIDEPDKKKDNK